MRTVTCSSSVAMHKLYLVLAAASLLGPAAATLKTRHFTFGEEWQRQFISLSKAPIAAKLGPLDDDAEHIPIHITNQCEDAIWPGIATQSGTGPGVGGFELESGGTSDLKVSPDWQGRIWGRTNCTVSGDSASCETGDCFGKMNCEFSVSDHEPDLWLSEGNNIREQHRRRWPSSTSLGA